MERRRNLPSVVYVVEQAVLLGGAEIDGLFWTLTKTRPRKSEPRTVQNPTWDARQVPVPKYVQQWPCERLNQQDELQDGCECLGFSLCRGKYEKSLLIIHRSGVYLVFLFFLKKGTVSTRLKRLCFYSTFRERVSKVSWGQFCSFRIELQFSFGRISFRHLKTSHIGFYSSTTQLSSFMTSLFLFFSVPSTCLICNDPYTLL